MPITTLLTKFNLLARIIYLSRGCYETLEHLTLIVYNLQDFLQPSSVFNLFKLVKELLLWKSLLWKSLLTSR